ncbi:hypothetical protein M5689_009276 [Euphorbia peplus]|nr:hypothetical protein M5689_009276 [Euphorbia peplus]
MSDSLIERFLLLPFSFPCSFHSSKEREGSSIKKSFGFLSQVTKPKIHNFITTFKSLPQLFGHNRREMEMEMEMEIGYPSDVKHIAHIGADGNGSASELHLKAAQLISSTQFDCFMPNISTISS